MKNKTPEYYLAIDELRQSVNQVFGKHVTITSNCEALADILFSKYQINISVQTLRRFFKLIDPDSNPSNFTLDALSKFCGYKDFDEFYSVQANKDLITYFGQDDLDENYCSKAEDLCKRVMTSPKFLVTTHQQLMEYPMVRKFFLEHYPMRDMLGTVYSQYFLAYLKYNQSDEAKIFAYGFLFKSAFLQENDELIHLYFNKIKDIAVTTDIFVVPAGLKFGIQLLYADYVSNEAYFEHSFSEMKKWRKKFIPQSKKSACSFEYSVLELLIFTDRVKEINFLIDNNTQQIYPDRKFVSEERMQTHREVWKILCAAAYHKMGDKQNCLEHLNTINLNNLGIGWNKYYTILYYFICTQIADSSIPSDSYSKLISLIDETYFYHYRSALYKVFENDKTRNMIKKIS